MVKFFWPFYGYRLTLLRPSYDFIRTVILVFEIENDTGATDKIQKC